MNIRTLCLVCAAAAAAAFAPLAQAESRAEVKQAFFEARSSNMLVANGEISDTDQVLASREAFNRRQTEQIAALRAERLAGWATYEEAERQRLAWVRDQELLAQRSATDTLIVAAPTDIPQSRP